MIIATTKKIGTVDALSMYSLIIDVMQKHYNQILEVGDASDQVDFIQALVEADLKAKYGFTATELTAIDGGLKWKYCIPPMWDTLVMNHSSERTVIEI